MCIKPKKINGYITSCGGCEKCLQVIKRDWVARAMAEKTLHPHCYLFALTYGSETQWQRDGAAMFRYGDVNDFLKRLRRTVEYHHGKENGLIRFICAGEQGSANGRVHYHIVIYSKIDLLQVGQYYGLKNMQKVQLTAPSDLLTLGKGDHEVRLDWTLWPHGFVTVQMPDEQGMAYAMSYAIKDQFSHEKSKGHAREGKTETFATGVFRPSKFPPIGWEYAKQWVANLASLGQTSPDLQIQIPDLKGYWYPRGQMRKKLLALTREVNNSVYRATGRNTPQWRTLLNLTADKPSQMEILLHGQKEKDPETAETIIGKRQRESADDKRKREIARRCGSTIPCVLCLRSCESESLSGLGIEQYQHGGAGGAWSFRFVGDSHHDRLHQAQKDGACGGINPLCKLAESPSVKKVFVGSTQSARK